jgi:hypothetical protein
MALLALAIPMAACGDDEPQNNQQDAGQGTDAAVHGDGGECSSSCGLSCCTQGQVCVDGSYCCTPACDGKQCGPNGCGGTCGECAGGQTCNEAGQCVGECVSETKDEFCARLQKNCGPVTAKDNCEVERSYNCGTCQTGTCNLQTNTCTGCEYEGDNAFCYSMGAQCGPATGEDNCGQTRTVDECGPCSPGLQCDTLGQCAECTPETDAAFCLRLSKNCDEVTARDSCNVTRTVDCGDCTGANEQCTDNVCIVPGAPANDNCLGAEMLDTSTGQATVTADTTNASDSGHGACGGSNTVPDVVYQLHLDAVTNVDVLLTPAPSLDTVLYVRKVCDSTDPADSVGCIDRGAGVAEHLSFESLPAGDYFIWVDGYYPTSTGASTLDVSLSTPPPPPDNDQCGSGVAALGFTGDVASATGTTLGAANDVSSVSCGSVSGGDVVYSFEITGTDNRSVNVTVTPDTSSSTFQPAIYVRSSDCATGNEVLCGKASSAGSVASVSSYSLPPGTYYVFVDGVSASKGGFGLSVQLGAAITLPEDCTSAMPLAFVNGTVTVTGDTSTATDNGNGSCGNSSAKDLVYSFTIDPAQAPMNVKATLDSPGWDAVIYLRNACPATSDLGCMDSPEEISAVLPAGTYYIWIDGYSASSAGPFSLTVSQAAPIDGDTCSNAVPLTFTGSQATVSGDTTNATQSGNSTCATTTYRDLVYTFTTTATKNFQASVQFTGTSIGPNLYLRKNACDSSAAADELACDQHSSGGNATISAADLPAGTYWIWVDHGYSGEKGPFTLDVTLTDPVPNDGCGLPEPIVLTYDSANHQSIGSAFGDTTGAFGSGEGSCGGQSVDLVYELTLQTEQTVDIELLPDSGSALDPILYVRSTCDADSAEVPNSCAASSVGNPATVTFPRLAAGTYYVWVDGAQSTKGPFSLNVTTHDPSSAPANDVCDGEVLDLSSGSASVTEETTAANNDTTGTCADSSGADLVYQVTTGQPGKLTVAVAPDSATSSSFKPVVYVRDLCGSAADVNELTCAHGAAGATATAVINALPAGTYYIFVDGADGTFGRFTLSATLGTVATGPANESCFAPQVIAVDTSTGLPASATVTGTTVGAINEASGSCSSSSAGDVVYALTTQAAHKITAKLTPTSSGLDPALYIRSSCGSSAASNQLVCNTSSPSIAVINNAQPGTYYVWVDGHVSGTAGDFSLQVTLDNPIMPPANDTCGTAIALQAGAAAVSGDTTTATDNYGTTESQFTTACDSALYDTYGGQVGPDLVYSFTPTLTGTFTVTVEDDFDSALWVTPVCDTASGALEGACLGASDDGSESVRVNGTIGTTYYIVVDSYSTSAKGTFTITVTE